MSKELEVKRELIVKKIQTEGGTSRFSNERQENDYTTLIQAAKRKTRRHRQSRSDQIVSDIKKFIQGQMFRKASFIMAGIVVFATTYSLVLPALTLDHDSLSDLPGLHLGQKPVVVEVLNSESTGRDDGDILSSNESSSSVRLDEQSSDSKESSETGDVSTSGSEAVADTHTELLWVDKDADTDAIEQAVEEAFGDQAVKDQDVRKPEQDAKKENTEKASQNETGVETGDDETPVKVPDKEPPESVDDGQEQTISDASVNDKEADADITELEAADEAVGTNESEKSNEFVKSGESTKSLETVESTEMVKPESTSIVSGTIEVDKTVDSHTGDGKAPITDNSPAGETAVNEPTIDEATASEEKAEDGKDKQIEEEIAPYEPIDQTVTKKNEYSIHVTAGADAQIPADAILTVSEIPQNSLQYYTLASITKDTLSDSSASVVYNRFFDISFVVDGQTIEPKAAVNVEISFDKAQELPDEQKLSVVHFAENQKAISEVLDNSPSITEEGMVESVSFETGSFSVFGVVYTVDFTYESRTWSFPGKGSYRLTDVLAALGIEGSIDDAALTLIMGEDHVDALYLTQADGEYYINSDIAFTDTYELKVRSAERVYLISVTDTQTSTDLSVFLKNAVITGATQDPNGSYHVEAGEEYSIILTFAEGSDYQFDNTGTLSYQIPEGIEILTRQESDGNINIVYKGRTYQVSFHYVLETNGSLQIIFDTTDPDFPRLEESTNVSFRFTYTGEFDGSKTKIIFNDVVERDITFDEPEPGQAYVEKTGEFDATTGKMKYKITVTADGDVTNVNVKDVISGNALTFNNDVQIQPSGISYTNNGATNGFDYTFASMDEGETITITYSANVKFDQDTDKDGKIIVDQTKNTVTVQPEDGPPHTSSFSREISFINTDKSNGAVSGETADGDKIIDWVIDYNPLVLAPAAGYTITDRIAAGSASYMKYYGTGIIVEVYKNGTLKETRNVSYTDLTNYSDSTWTYTIPAGDTDPYHYIIKYQTVVDMNAVNNGHVPVSLNNTANGDPGEVDVTPDEGYKLAIKKDYSSYTTEEINWVAYLDVPARGLDSATVTDTLPSVYLPSISRTVYDLYKDGTLEVTGLLPGESYVPTFNTNSIVISFKKNDEGTTIDGLLSHEGGHRITIKLTTKVDQNWLNDGYDQDYLKKHTNTIRIDNQSDTATVVFDKPIVKNGNYDPNTRKFTYTIILNGVSQVPVSIQDEFDTSLLEVVNPAEGDWENMTISGGHIHDSQIYGKLPISYTETPNGVLLTANAVPMNDGQYYPYYKIVYYLRLKEGVDLEQLAIAKGGEYDLTNTANWNGHESEFTYKTTYDYIDKKLLNEKDLGGTSREAQYQITFNSAKATLNNGEPMIMTDVMSANLSVDYSSIHIETDPAGQEVPYTLSGGKDENGDPDGTTVATYTVPDSTKVTITYTASVRGNGTQTIINKVSVKDKEEKVEIEKSYGSASEGSGAIASFKIVKVDGYDANKKLEGVRFRIFAENPNIDFGGGVKELVLETDENGEIVIDGEQYQIMFGEIYHVREVEPLEDYGTIGFDYLVKLTNDMEQVDYDHYVYYYSDSMQIKNWPLEGLVVEKKVESPDNSDKEQYYPFRISILKDDGTVDTSYNEKNGDDQFANGVVTFELKDKEQKMFWGFQKDTKYMVEEIDSNGLATSVTYSVFDEDGNVTDTITESGVSHTGTLTQENEVIVFTNSKTEEKGALKLTKAVTIDGKETTSAATNGAYTFTVTGPGTSRTVSKTVVIKVDNGVATQYKIDNATTYTDLLADKFVVISDLTPGEYTITETSSTNTNMTLASITGGKDGTANVQNKQVTVTVTAGETIEAAATATFTNNLPTTEVEVNKTWLVGTTDYSGMLDEMFGSVTVELGVVKVATNATDEEIKAAEIVKDILGNDAKATMSATTWSATVSNLPVLETGYKYAVKELSVKSGDTDLSSYFDATLNGTTVNNAPKLTEVKVTKQWKPVIPENTKITLYLYSGKAAATANTQITTIVLDGTADDVAENISSTDTKAGTKQETAGWTAEFKNLPKYAYDTTDGIYEIKYVVKESVVPDGYTVNYGGEGAGSDYVINGGTITNKESSLALDILKVDKAGTTITTGASFRIVQINDTDQADEKTGTEKTGTTNNEGKLTFDGLTVGYYKITEQTPPPGYVLPIDATFYVEVTETDIKLLTKGTGKPSTWDKTQTSGGVVKTFTMKTENSNAQATVENTPGTALPSTGGPGTMLIYSLGAVVAEITGYNILSKRRKKYLNGQKHKIMKKRWS